MAERTQLGSLESEKWLVDIPGFTDVILVLLVTKCHTVDSSQISHLCHLFFCQYSFGRHLRFITTCEVGTKTDLKTETFAVFENIRFVTAEQQS